MSHPRIVRFALTALLLTLAVLLVAGCPDTGQAPPPTDQPVATTVAQISPTAPAADTPTDVPAATAAPATSTPTTAPTATPTPTTTAPPTDTPAPLPIDTPVPAPQPQTARSANLRAGPGTNYEVVGSATAQEPVEVTGRNEAGDWLEIQTAHGEAWIAAFLVGNVDLLSHRQQRRQRRLPRPLPPDP